jgi:hypothetical protein
MGMTKTALVRTLMQHFARVHDLSNPTGNDLKARDWLPETMGFPAADPAARADADEEADDAETGEEALAA